MDTRNEWRNQLISEHAEVARRIALKMLWRAADRLRALLGEQTMAEAA